MYECFVCFALTFTFRRLAFAPIQSRANIVTGGIHFLRRGVGVGFPCAALLPAHLRLTGRHEALVRRAQHAPTGPDLDRSKSRQGLGRSFGARLPILWALVGRRLLLLAANAFTPSALFDRHLTHHPSSNPHARQSHRQPSYTLQPWHHPPSSACFSSSRSSRSTQQQPPAGSGARRPPAPAIPSTRHHGSTDCPLGKTAPSL